MTRGGPRLARTIAACLLFAALFAAGLALHPFRGRLGFSGGPDGPKTRSERAIGGERTPGESSQSAAPEAPLKIVGWRVVEDFPEEIALFETVFWDPRDTTTLRRLIRRQPLVRDKTVLEIGTGSGLLSLCCLRAGARRVVATDVNAAAVANAAYNADLLGLGDRLETRRVPLSHSGAYRVIGPNERFDVIISNPPWEDSRPTAIDQFALYDEDFQLLRSILEGLPLHLTSGGTAYLAYGSVSSVRQTLRLARELGLSATVLDDRNLDALTEVFLPAMVIQVAPPASEKAAEGVEATGCAADLRQAATAGSVGRRRIGTGPVICRGAASFGIE